MAVHSLTSAVAVFLLFLPGFPGVAGAGDAKDRPRLFVEYLKTNAEGIWAPSISPQKRKAIEDYANRVRLSSGEVYGDSVRKVNLGNKTVQTTEKEALTLGFQKHECVFWDYKTKKPKVDGTGARLPLWVYVHSDGSKVRVKPKGDPDSPFRRKPDSIKSVLFPPDADPCDYSFEMFAVDRAGRAIPKNPTDLANPYEGKPEAKKFLDDWAEEAHTYLKP